jgi:hypothetical protein
MLESRKWVCHLSVHLQELTPLKLSYLPGLSSFPGLVCVCFPSAYPVDIWYTSSLALARSRHVHGAAAVAYVGSLGVWLELHIAWGLGVWELLSQLEPYLCGIPRTIAETGVTQQEKRVNFS